MSQSQEKYDDMSTLNEIYLKQALKGILKLQPDDGVRISLPERITTSLQSQNRIFMLMTTTCT